MIRNLLWVLIALGLLFGGIFGWKYFQAEEQTTLGGMMPAVVSTQTVREESWQPTLPSVGSLTPTRGVVVASEVAGVIREIHFDSGQVVKANDYLVQLDAEVDMAEAVALDADRKLAETTRDRLKKIVSSNLGSRADLDEAQAQVDSTRARVEAKQATIRKKTIRAPFAGELGIRYINPGQYLAAGDEIIELVDLDPIYADYTLPERYLSSISVGQELVVTVAARPEVQFPGKISAISPNIEKSSRSVQVRAILENPDQQLHPGMFAEVHTLLPQQDAVLTIPERAISYNPYGNAVFVVDSSQGMPKAQRVQVTTGMVNNGRVEILEGLKAGDEVVTDGHHKLFNGQPVSVDNSSLPDDTGSPQ